MKKSLLILATTALAAPTSAYEIINNEMAYLNIYGEVQARAFFYANKSNDYTFGGSRIGIDARYALTDTINILTLVEGEMNFDAEDARDEDELYFSKAYIGAQHEILGQLTFGDHATASDDLEAIDYSEAFGEKANLNPASTHEQGLKYKYDNEAFTLIALYGAESGDVNREIKELYVQFNLADEVRFISGVGTSSTNTPTNQLDTDYLTTSFEMIRGDLTYGATYYYANVEDRLDSNRDVSKNAFAVASRMEVIEKLFGYTGYEYITHSSSTASLDGNVHNVYLGTRYDFVEWANVFAEVNYADDSRSSTNDGEVNFALGGKVFW